MMMFFNKLMVNWVNYIQKKKCGIKHHIIIKLQKIMTAIAKHYIDLKTMIN